MMRSLYSGVSGLKVHQTKMDVIGNNISNVNTVGFKSSQVNFSDILYQTTSSASGPNANSGTAGVNAKQIGLGASVASISSTMTVSGGSQRTDNALDIMIEGEQFFIVNNGVQNLFTKAGAFTVDANGTLCT
ncbi:MAG: flagellar hook-basal body complex protein, partial [Lachnospiraceae bacterium]|nr:flagellar hook-basal body complex protein [Lachnospiraceae bacterium]